MSESACDDPQAYRRVIDARWYANNRERKQAYAREHAAQVRAARHAAGLCVKCGVERCPTNSLRCPECREKARVGALRRRRDNHQAGKCVVCQQPSGRSAQRCQSCVDKSRNRLHLGRIEDQRFVISALGGRCACSLTDCFHTLGSCPVADDRVLTVDHVNRDGVSHRRRTLHPRDVWQLYARAIRNGSHALQLLCPTCHHLKDTPRFQRVMVGPRRQ